MVYRETDVVHQQGYVPAGPPDEYDRRARPLNVASTIVITTIEYDDAAGEIPAGGPEELERYDLIVPSRVQNKEQVTRFLEQTAMPRLQQIITAADAGFNNNNQRDAAIRDLARGLRRVIRIQINLLDATD